MQQSGSDDDSAGPRPDDRARSAGRAGLVRIGLSALGLASAWLLPALRPLLWGFVGYFLLALVFQWLVARRFFAHAARPLLTGLVDIAFASLLIQRVGSGSTVLPLLYVVIPVLYTTTTSQHGIAHLLAGAGAIAYGFMVLLELLELLPYGAMQPALAKMPPPEVMLLDVLLVSGCALLTAVLTSQLLASLERVNRRLRDLSQLDELTGLRNRRYLLARMENELSRLRRGAASLSVVMVDLDGFKRVNDEIGHGTGDAVLRAVAAALLEATRKADIVARYGGDEFVILLPETDLPGARVIAARVVDFARRAARAACPAIVVTASVGASEVSPDDDPVQVIRRVDELLYRAKRAGGDRVADPEGLGAPSGPVAALKPVQPEP
ncbi:MAG: GGDEF domain-containing protein [Myxococcales bacterium]|nr:GGDEF domain-containing protein [Myxococcales bacterium]